MFKNILILIVLTIIIYPLEGQTYDKLNFDTLNHVDEKGKKTGYWIELLSSDFKIVKKAKKASFYRYVYFQNDIRFGTKIFTYVRSFMKIKIKPDSTYQIGKIKLLDGYYSIHKPKTNILIKEFLFKNGYIINFKEYYDNGKIGLDVDYTQKYEDYIYSCYFTMYDEKGGIMLKGYHVLKDGDLKYIDRRKDTE